MVCSVGEISINGREPVRIARGTYCALSAHRNEFCDGEILYAEDLRALFIAECRNSRIELNPVRTTIRPEAAPAMRFLGYFDISQPDTAPTTAQHGDLVINVNDGIADPAWGLPDPAEVSKGDVLIYDEALPGWSLQPNLVGLPDIPIDLSLLPELP